jgi:2,3-bisphosphoglycerate-dependent phosphoglycerate mutase
MVFIVLRHGQSIWNKANILTGWTDIPLSSQGMIESIQAANILKKYEFDYVFTSDLLRTIETCSIIKNILNQNFIIETSPDLKERDYGLVTGKKKDELIKEFTDEDIQKWRSSYYGRPPGGENLHDVRKRIGNYYDKSIFPILKEDKNVLVISHSNSLRALFVHLGLKNETNVEDFLIDNCIPININIINKEFHYENYMF